MQIINLNNISYSYGNTPVLNNLNMSIESNELTCLLGSSGSGKTTILRLIAGLEIPQKGEVVIDNTMASANRKLLVQPNKRKVGYIFQDLALWPHFTVYKNIAFGLAEQKEKDIKEKVFEILDFFELQEFADRFPHQLSGGQKQLVAISRSLVLKPKVLLMDEPLANLDVKLKHKIMNHIKNLKNKFNLTIIYVTHDHKEAFALANNIVVLNDGNIEDSGKVEHIKHSNNKFVKYFLEY